MVPYDPPQKVMDWCREQGAVDNKTLLARAERDGIKLSSYDGLYLRGGFGYDAGTEERFLRELTDLDLEGAHLLDITSGDGFWSGLLSRHYKVTGIDLSPVGVFIAKRDYPACDFIWDDFLKHDFGGQKFDICFCRGVSFLNFNSSTEEWHRNLARILAVCKKKLVYIQSTNPPYGTFTQSGTYNVLPEEVKANFEKYGRVVFRFMLNYIGIQLYV